MDQPTLKRLLAVGQALERGREELAALNDMIPEAGEPPWLHLPIWVVPGRVLEYLQDEDYTGAMALILALQEERDGMRGMVWG